MTMTSERRDSLIDGLTATPMLCVLPYVLVEILRALPVTDEGEGSVGFTIAPDRGRELLFDLLSAIHRDKGQHLYAHGLEKAVADAIEIVKAIVAKAPRA